MKTMKDFKGTQGEFRVGMGATAVVSHEQNKDQLTVAKNTIPDSVISAVEVHANMRLFANSKKVLEAAIGVCREFDDPNDSVEAFKKLEQAINDSL